LKVFLDVVKIALLIAKLASRASEQYGVVQRPLSVNGALGDLRLQARQQHLRITLNHPLKKPRGVKPQHV
jgi:hypothetical protein